MIVEPDFLTHWKTQMLAGELGDTHAPIYVIALWAHCQQRKSANLNVSDSALKAICRFPGEAEKLKAGLLASGFIKESQEGITAHGWEERNAKLLANWQNGPRGGRPKKPTDNPPITQPKPNPNPQGTDKNRVDKNREEREQCVGAADCITASRPDLRDKWAEWVDFRMTCKKPKSWLNLFTKQAEWLKDYNSAQFREIIGHSLRNGYTGLFPPKGNPGDNQPLQPAVRTIHEQSVAAWFATAYPERRYMGWYMLEPEQQQEFRKAASV